MSGPTWLDDDPDPTGVRILLSAEPDPGPMPTGVSDRILAALAEASRRADLDAEAGSRELRDELGLTAAETDSGGEFGGDFGDHRVEGVGRPGVRDVTATEPLGRVGPAAADSAALRRRRWTVLGSVAASVAALGLAGSLLTNLGGASTTSASRASSGAVADTAPQAAAATGAPEGGAPPAATPFSGDVSGQPRRALPTDASGRVVHIEASRRDYMKATIARLAQGMLDSPGAELGPSTGEASPVGPVGTPLGLAECVATLGEADADAVYADVATFQGAPAVVVVVVQGDFKQVFAVQRSCSKGDPGLLYGPAVMP